MRQVLRYLKMQKKKRFKERKKRKGSLKRRLKLIHGLFHDYLYSLPFSLQKLINI